jgi:hypothetical protein
MSCRTSHPRRRRRPFAVLAFAAALLATSAGALRAEPVAAGANAESAGLVGTWTIQVTLRDCASNAALGSFNSLVTFHRGGTISESAGSLTFEAGQRSAAQGTWARKGDNKFRQRMIALILFESPPNLPGTPTFDPSSPVSPGFRAGWQTVTHTIDVVDADHLTSAGTNAFYDATGAVYRTGCSTSVGQRFK